ncbi:MAG TPA: hypothetical protein PKL17_17645, partial [Pseudomonadota bacterium]|nr:hypothetical protein [Pseudomonadota bacterium]
MTNDSRSARNSRRGCGRLGRFMLALTLASAAGVFEAKAHAQDYAAAGQHFDAAQEAFAAGKFELAAKEYQAAFDITKESTLLQSIGESWQ